MELLKAVGPLLQQVAPTLATALGGPLAGLATKTLSEALFGKADASVDDMVSALGSASPETLAKLKEVDADFQVQMRKLDIDLAAIDAKDRDSARRREVETKDSTPKFLALAVVVGFFSVLTILALYGMPQRGGDAILIMIGSLGAAFTAIVSYYYGSSVGSAAKNELLKK